MVVVETYVVTNISIINIRFIAPELQIVQKWIGYVPYVWEFLLFILASIVCFSDSTGVTLLQVCYRC